MHMYNITRWFIYNMLSFGVCILGFQGDLAWMQIVGWVVSCVVSCQGKHPVAVTRATRSASGISIFNFKQYFPVFLFCICIFCFRDFYFKNWISCWIYFIIFGRLIPGFLLSNSVPCRICLSGFFATNFILVYLCTKQIWYLQMFAKLTNFENVYLRPELM